MTLFSADTLLDREPRRALFCLVYPVSIVCRCAGWDAKRGLGLDVLLPFVGFTHFAA